MKYDFNRLVDNIQVDKISTRDLYEEASKQSRKEDTIILDQNNVYRWMVNTVRHNHSNYEAGLKNLHKLNNTEDDYHIYKNAVLDKISNEYPNLTDECNSQKEPVNMIKIIKKKRFKNGKRKSKRNR